MKRLLVVSVAALALLVGSVVAVSAQTPPNEGWSCPGWGAGADGSYDYSGNVTFKAVAGKLGLDAAGLTKALQEGKSIAELAKGAGVGLDELAKIVNAPRVEMMGIMSEYGYASDEQIKAMNEWMDAQTKAGFERPGYFGGMMGGGMMGGMTGGRGGFGGMMGGDFGGTRGQGNFGGMMGGQRGFGGMMGGFGSN